jgi:hypothetical protein
MKIHLLILSLLLLTFSPAETKVAPAALIFTNGNIYTANDRQPNAQAIAVKNDRIVYVGTNSGREAVSGANTRVIDLHGVTVLPGLTDAHYHFIGVGAREMNLNLEGITNLQDFLAKVKTRVDQAKPDEWVTGRGWIETFWTPPVFPTRWDLDKIAPNNPVFLTRADGHGAVANSAALKIGGVTKETKDPFGGQVVRDKDSGEPDGNAPRQCPGFSFEAHSVPRAKGIPSRQCCSPISAASCSVGRRCKTRAAVIATLSSTKNFTAKGS